ncbi:Hpt domain-containing protein [Aquabacterium sp. OR-4]|uniref:Hpt domain-containing protein n=1 Tax=Aquabacterium sp. OR-4 TaxID=2978127 RepID=UPI0021B1EC60|nr:Hpt domain-containing protein [Aquabacterium sp. OR-4]MDT7836244.1 Hpt domain-containing protein [Aquabacterium sp. OR-4]
MLPELTGCDDEMRDEFLSDFRATLGEARSELLAALQAAQAGVLASAAHRVKSSARYMGAMPLGQLCEQLEQAGDRADLAAARGLLAQWQAESLRVEGFIASHLGLA